MKSQSHFNTIEFNAAIKGMMINNNKTKMMCVSNARTYVLASYILTTTGERIETVNSMKILGFNFNTSPSVKYHLKVLQRKFKSRIWALRHFKRNGFKQNELLRVYKSMVRPLAEYCSPVFHTMISQSDSLELERIQMQALKGIYGWRLSYNALLEKSGIERLEPRRENRFLELAKKMHQSKRFAHWFPLRLNRRPEIRPTGEKFKIYHAASERYARSPLNVMRRKLNEFYAQ